MTIRSPKPRGVLARGPRLRRLTVATLSLLVSALIACVSGDAPEPATAEATSPQEKGGTVQVDSAGAAAAGIRLGPVVGVAASGLSVTGTITYDANLVSHIGSRTAGRVIEVRADLGDPVRRGQLLAVLESPEIGQVRSEETEAEALLEIAQENFNREKRLETQGISSRKELLVAQADLRRAEAALRGSRQRLRVLGAGHGKGGEFGLTSPFAGAIIERHVTRGEMAAPEDQLFVVADLSRVWVLLDIFERDLRAVRVGQQVRVTTPAFPDRQFTGRIVYLGATLDSTTRTVQARVEVPNRDQALRPGMFATATIESGDSATTVAAIPRDAVQVIAGREMVFGRGDHSGEFRPHPVVTGSTIGSNLVEIRSGLSIGDSIVVAGAFMLRSELAKGEIGEHGH
ncbi:MAG: efflux RND transporter periplasmic adaptor subunit [Gemmatimonadales bacterium]